MPSLEVQLVDAGLALLRAIGTPPAYPTATGFTPPEPALPYYRVYTAVEWPETGTANALDGRAVTAAVRWYVHSVAENEYAAENAAGLGRAAMLNQRPMVTGRAVGFIRHEASEPTRRDDSGPATVFDKVDVYRMDSFPG